MFSIPANVLKIIGIVDGVAVAGLLELGHLVPADAVWTTPTAQIIGMVGTLLGATPPAVAMMKARAARKALAAQKVTP